MTARQKVLKTFCTSLEAAKILGVSQRTVQLWVESGLLEAWKTQGGHRRISRKSIEGLLAIPPVRTTGTAQELHEGAKTGDAGPPAFNILVVEDDEFLRLLYEVNISRWPMRPKVVTASDGFEALIRIGKVTPDLLILDLNMPGMDGFSMLKAICNMPELANTAVIVVTGLDVEEIKNRGSLPEGIPVLPKPVPFDQLKELAVRLAHKPSTEASSA